MSPARPAPEDEARRQPPQGRGRWLAVRLALVLGGLLGALLLLEGGLRLLPEPDAYATRMRAFADGALRADPALHHRVVGGADVTVAGVRYRFTEAGSRGVRARADVLVVGDSVTMGWGVAAAEAFPAQLEAALGRPGATVANGGVVGYGVEQVAAWLEELLPAVRPRVVVVGYYPNDPEAPGASSELEGLGWSRLWRRLRPALHSLAVGLGWADGVTDYHRALHAPGSPGWARVERGLAAVGRSCRARRLRCALALLPQLALGEGEAWYPLAEVHRRVAEVARREGLVALDLAPRLAPFAADLPATWVAPDDSHPGPAVHAVYGRAVAEAIRGWL